VADLAVGVGVVSLKQAECTEQERWYGTKYSAGPIPADWLQVRLVYARRSAHLHDDRCC
jgi:hypothetical protein